MDIHQATRQLNILGLFPGRFSTDEFRTLSFAHVIFTALGERSAEEIKILYDEGHNIIIRNNRDMMR